MLVQSYILSVPAVLFLEYYFDAVSSSVGVGDLRVWTSGSELAIWSNGISKVIPSIEVNECCRW